MSLRTFLQDYLEGLSRDSLYGCWGPSKKLSQGSWWLVGVWWWVVLRKSLKRSLKGQCVRGLSVCLSVYLSVCLSVWESEPQHRQAQLVQTHLAYTIHHPPGSPKATKPVFVKLAAGRKFQKQRKTKKNVQNQKTGFALGCSLKSANPPFKT